MHPGLLLAADRTICAAESAHGHAFVHLHADLVHRGVCAGDELRILVLRGRRHRQQQGHGALPRRPLHVPAHVADPDGHLGFN